MAVKNFILGCFLVSIQFLNAQENSKIMPLYLKSGNQYLAKNIQEWTNSIADSLIHQSQVWPILQFNSIPTQEQ
ncbi:MAG: hypothetical protein KDC92_05415, partial [Bacteroidetes bacterium]|nr:hypothetical protein [Bacteroidota bacterium]